MSGVGFVGDGDALLAVARRASNGPRLWQLWEGDWSDYASLSEALIGLAGFLGFYTGPDPRRLFALMSLSPLVAVTEQLRPKWWSPRPRGEWGYACYALPAVRNRAVYFSGRLVSGSEYKPPTCVTKSVSSTPGGRLMAMSGRLAGKRPDGSFHLSARSAAKEVGVSKTHAARLLAAKVAGGELVLVERGDPNPRTRRASVYRLP